MGASDKLRNLDDKALRMGRGDGLSSFLRVVWRVSKAVFFLLALVVVLGIVFTKAPVNNSNVIVRNALQLAKDAAGPFKDVFAPKTRENALIVNYLLAAGVYAVVGIVVGRLPTGGKR